MEDLPIKCQPKKTDTVIKLHYKAKNSKDKEISDDIIIKGKIILIKRG